MKLKNRYLIAFVATLILIANGGFVLADDLATQCASISQSADGCSSLSSADCKAMLQKCADYYDQQSAQISQDLTKTSQQKNTLQNAIKKLKSKISSLEADINQGKIMVKDLNLQISDTQKSIDKTTAQIQASQGQISTILQSVYKEDRKPSFVILLQGDLSDFFSNMAYLDSLNSEVGNLLSNTKNLQDYLHSQKTKMSDNVDQLQKTVALQTLQKTQSEQDKLQQNQYLKLTEDQYQQQLKDKQDIEQKATKIKSMLFEVAGVTQAPTFGQAIDIAKAVSNLISIRPAFLLAVLSQESALGKNVGSCLLTDSTTGVGKKKATGAYVPNLLKPSTQLKPYMTTVAALGRDPYNSILSCPISSGYDGGSMGPAQFIPSTWIMFADRLKVLLSHPADPWVIKDSFAASAMYLSDLGASAQTTTAEANAAYHYNGSGNMARVYSRSVMSRATCIQSFIDSSTMTADCQRLILGR